MRHPRIEAAKRSFPFFDIQDYTLTLAEFARINKKTVEGTLYWEEIQIDMSKHKEPK